MPGKSTVAANNSLSLTVDGLRQKGEGCGERKFKKKKECERQAEASKEDLIVSLLKAPFASFECESACLSPSIFVVRCV